MKRGIVITLSFIAGAFAFSEAGAQDIYAGRYNAVLTAPPKMVPAAKTPDGALAGNGDIGLTLGGAPDNLQCYFGKNDFWRAYPVYPGGGIAHPGGLTVGVRDLKGGSYYAVQVMDKAAIKGRFNKNGLQVSMNAWVAATRNLVVLELSASQACEVDLRLWSRGGNTSVNDSGYSRGVYWVSRSFENTPLLEWPCHVAMAMKIIGYKAPDGRTVQLLPGKKLIVAVTIHSSFDNKEWKESAVSEAEGLTGDSIAGIRAAHENWWRQFWSASGVRIGDPYLEKYYYASQYL
ncbi:MAG TPA: hypothetical protein VLD19_14970, partial [Chitinophagaceae bacterium]|nr:hypothetical protein [Chitinophagaceae bacterium]